MLATWNERFPNCEPVAHLLRCEFPDRWVRFHSLPDSKRWPKDEAEYAILLERHNCILGELASDGDDVVLLTAGYSGTAEPVRSEHGPELAVLDPTATAWRSVAVHKIENDDEPNFIHVFASRRRWRPGEFDRLVRLVANDVLGNVMIVALDCKWLLHPYDGGMDVILESDLARDQLKARYSEWQSHRADGL